jgi:tetratricopeptide (TPR) repeat protein
MNADVVGRDGELASLTAAVERALAGHAGLVLIAGEPGIGKTALARAAGTYGEDRGAVVLWGPCWESEGAPAYWPWAQVIRSYARGRRTDELFAQMGAGASDIARIVPEVGGRFLALTSEADVDPEQARFRLFDNICTFLRAASESQPLVIVLDDLHWADRSSLMLLRFAAQTLRDARVLLIGTYRDVEITPDHPFVETVGDLTVERVPVTGLARAHVASLIAATTGALPKDDLTDVVAGRTSGNPFFVKEVAQLLAAQGKLDQQGRVAVSAIPEGVRDVVRRRLARLSQQCVDLLAAAAVLGPEFALDVLAEASGSATRDILPILEEAIAARIVSEVQGTVGRYAFAHSLTREVIYDGLGPARRSLLHWNVGVLLEKRNGHLAEVATHLVQGAPSGVASKAASVAMRAARDALAMYAWDQAVTLYERALEVLPSTAADEGRRLHMLLELGDARTSAGDLIGARLVFDQAATLATGGEFATELAHAALGFGGGLGGFEVPLFNDRQIDLLERALDALPREDSAVRAWLLARLSVATSFVRPFEERARLSNEAIEMAARIGDDAALSYALSSLCDALSGPDHVLDRIDASTRMVELSERPASGVARCGVASCTVCLCNPEFALLGRRVRIVANLERGDVDAVDADVEVYTRLAEHLRQPLYLTYVPIFRGMRALMLGDFATVERSINEAIAMRGKTSSENASVLIGSQRAGLAFERGDFAASRRALMEMLDSNPELLKAPSASMIPALMEGLFGDPGSADPALQNWLDQGGLAAQPKDSEWIVTGVFFTEMALRHRSNNVASHIYEHLLPYEHEYVVDSIAARFMGSVAYHLGRLSRQLGRYDDSEQHLVNAIDAHERVRAPLWAARSRLELARLLAISGDARVDLKGKLAHAAAATFARFGLGSEAKGARAIAEGAPADAGHHEPLEGNIFRHEGEFWTVAFAGDVARVKDSKGLRDIASLLAVPGREIAAVDLGARDGGAVARAIAGGADTGEIVDEHARAAYKRRAEDLRTEIEEAEENNDPERADRARLELDTLTEHLSAAYGLGGRARRSGDPAERARKAVTERIRDAVAKLAKEHPALHRHLKASIKTGAFCSYTPERPVTWSF